MVTYFKLNFLKNILFHTVSIICINFKEMSREIFLFLNLASKPNNNISKSAIWKTFQTYFSSICAQIKIIIKKWQKIIFKRQLYSIYDRISHPRKLIAKRCEKRTLRIESTALRHFFYIKHGLFVQNALCT